MMDILSMDELSMGSSFVHKRHPFVKLTVTIAYILLVVSYDMDNLTGLMPMMLIPAVLFGLSDISVLTGLYKLRLVLPLVIVIGIWNPILNHTPAVTIGDIIVSEGMISFITLILKSVMTLLMSFLLIATTGIDGVCMALRKAHVPGVLVTLIMITYRYINVLILEAATMWEAYHLRAPGQKGVKINAWGSFLGGLLLRSMDRASDLYESMRLRGFNGDFDYISQKKITLLDAAFAIILIFIMVIFRVFNIANLIGELFI